LEEIALLEWGDICYMAIHNSLRIPYSLKKHPFGKNIYKISLILIASSVAWQLVMKQRKKIDGMSPH
jgi:hypothetical protein